MDCKSMDSANQWTGFYMITASVMKGLIDFLVKCNDFPLDARLKLNLHKTYRRRPGCFLNVLGTFPLHHTSTRLVNEQVKSKKIRTYHLYQS